MKTNPLNPSGAKYLISNLAFLQWRVRADRAIVARGGFVLQSSEAGQM